MKVSFRNALTKDCNRLTEIAFASKRTWNYPEEYFEIWKDELTIPEKYIRNNEVIVALVNELIVGFVSVVYLREDMQFGQVKVSGGYWMDHLFIDPDFQHKGIGKRLMDKAINYCKSKGVTHLKIFVDPNATGFYEKVGAVFLENSPSSIERRTVHVYQLIVNY